MKRWSKLQKQLYAVLDNKIDFQIHCSVYRMDSNRGNTNIPRYWITLGKEILFDYPKQFLSLLESQGNVYPYETDISSISCLLREYLETPQEKLFCSVFLQDQWGLIPLLKAADRRIGRTHWDELCAICKDERVDRIIAARKAKRMT